MTRKLEWVETKLDGKQPIYWWDKEEFQNRSIKIFGGGFGKMSLQSEIKVPDEIILCDFCNEQVTDFPVPVFQNSHALCPTCYKELIK